MENILQLNSNTFFIDRKSNDFAIIENFLLKKASEKGIKDVEEIEIVISSDYNYDMEFKTREGSVRIKEAAGVISGIGKAFLGAGKDSLKGFFMGNHAPGTPMYDKIAGNPVGKLLSSGNMLTGLLGAAAGFATGGLPGALSGFVQGNSSGLLGIAINAGLAASGMGWLGLLVSAFATLVGSGALKIRNEELTVEQKQKEDIEKAKLQEAEKVKMQSEVTPATTTPSKASEGYYETVPKPVETKSIETKPVETKPIETKKETTRNYFRPHEVNSVRDILDKQKAKKTRPGYSL